MTRDAPVIPPLPVLQAPGWSELPALVHGFCGRRGGVSTAAFAELNMSRRVGDDDAAVAENWRRLTAAFPAAARCASMRQVHGDRVVRVSPTTLDAGEADALITTAAGVMLTILTADCVPLLLVAPHYAAVAAVHAGWRGTLAGIAVRAVEALARHAGAPPQTLRAALGPAIGGCCYEVDVTIPESLERRWGALPEAWHQGSSGKAFVDLRAVNTTLLTRAGVLPENIAAVGPCTRCASTEYFSYRAAGGVTGRQVSFVAWQV